MEYQTIANPDGTISIVPVNQAQGIMVPAYETSQLDLVDQINQRPKNIGVPMTLKQTMAGSVLPPDPRRFQSIFPPQATGIAASSAAIPFGTSVDIAQGFTQNTPSDQGTNFQFLSSANEADETDEVTETKTGIAKLFDFLTNFIPGVGLLKRLSDSGGIRSLNQKLRNTDFGQSRTGAEYFMKRRERKQAERAQEAMPDVYRSAREQGFTNDRGGFSTSRADRAGTSLGSGQFSSKRSTGRQGY